MSELIVNGFDFSDDVKKEFRVDDKGRCSNSIRGTARMFKLNHKTLCNHFSEGLEGSKLAEKLILAGFDVGVLKSFASDGIPDLALPIIADYYGFESRQVSQETKEATTCFIRVTSAIGVRTWIQHELGWKEESRISTLENNLNSVLNMIVKLNDKIDSQNKLLESSNEEKRKLKEENEELGEFQEKVFSYELFARLLELAENQIHETAYQDGGISIKEYLEVHGNPIAENKVCTLARRVASFYRSTRGTNPERKYGKFGVNIYRGKDVAFIMATIDLITRGI